MKQFLVNLWFQYRKKWGWFGAYPSFDAAAADCQGYDHAAILAKVRAAALAVKAGEAAFERDGVLFQTPEYLPFLSQSLQKVADTEGGLRVLDFGGSLGSTYFQYRSLLGASIVSWCVVEQPHFVAVGAQELADGVLAFRPDAPTACADFQPNVLLLSSVLQYLDKPYDWLQSLLRLNIKYVLIDKTPFVAGADRITKQIVPKSIYEASYPCWLLSLEAFEKNMNPTYTLIAENTNTDTINVLDCQFKGFFYGLNTP